MKNNNEIKHIYNKNLKDWFLESIDDGSLSTKKEIFISQFNLCSEELLKISEDAGKGALLNSFKNCSEYVYLNDHGPEHIKQVLKQVTKLLELGKIQISLYEAYLLLFAIYLHDCGNIHGREQHEKKTKKIMQYLGSKAGTNQYEKIYILSIASAHGGFANTTSSDKDTIGKIQSNDKINLKILAALLRLGDELADERGRESGYMMEGKEIPKESEIFHYYSYALYDLDFDEHTVKLNYEIKKSMIDKKYGKGKIEVYLIDEIKARTIKLFKESLYCTRFLKPNVDINKVIVNIGVYENFETDGFNIQPILQKKYVFEESGYPLENEDFEKLYPDLKDIDGEKIKQELFK